MEQKNKENEQKTKIAKKVIWFTLKCKRDQDFKMEEILNEHPQVLEVKIFCEKRKNTANKKYKKRNLYGIIFVKTHLQKGGLIPEDLKNFIVESQEFRNFKSYLRSRNADPILISDRSMQEMIKREESDKKTKIEKIDIHKIDFAINDCVNVLSGVFRGYEGEVLDIDYNTGIITLNIEFFGRITPIEVGFKECKKITELN